MMLLAKKDHDTNNTKDATRTDKNEDVFSSDPYFMSIPYGFQQRHYYEHNKKHTDLVDVTVNTRTRQFILLDTRGITTWTKDGISNSVSRSLSFPKYQNNLLRSIIFAKKFNVYFCLAHDFSLKVLNKNFEETCTADSDLSSVMFMVFNPIRDELITGGVNGTKIWEFKQIADRIWTEIKPMANYGLFLKKQLDSVGGSWVRKLELNEKMQHLYCCSDTDVSCYDMDGKFLFKISRAHNSQITGCKYSPQSKVLVTGSFDTEVKVWSMTGGLVHTFRGHSRAVTNVALHPESSSLVLTSSLDGTVRVWSLDIMEEIYSIVMSTEGILWMGIIADKFLWTATPRELSIWNIDQTVHFYALARSKVTSIQVAQSDRKTSRVVAVGDDSSVRLVSMRDQRNLSTVLPPPSLSPLQTVLAVSYNRECSLVYLLMNPEELWVYTMRTDPACRTAVWDVSRIQERFFRGLSAASGRTTPSSGTRPPSANTKSSLGNFQIRRATAEGMGPCPPSSCSSLTAVTTHVMYWTHEGFVSPLQTNFLVLGLQDGRILFLDPVKFGQRYCELQACKDAIIDLHYDSNNGSLIVRSHLREEDMFQIWSLPQLDLQYEVLARRDATCYAYSNHSFLVGHQDGSVILYKFLPGTMLGQACSLPDQDEDDKVDHTQPVLSVDSCTTLGIFISCSGDGIIKVWNQDKVLCTEILVEDSLTSAKFLNQLGDILIGYKNHLFFIHRSKVLSSIQKHGYEGEESFDTESEIYEDPAVKYEGAAANPDPLSLESYLVPYNLDFSDRFLGGMTSSQQSQNNSDEGGDSDSDSGFSMAPTYLYNSPASTPRRLSFVDLIVPGDCVTSEALRNQSVTIITKRKGGKLMLGVSRSDERQSLEDFNMPTFGKSPGPSPTPSPPSTPTDFDLSERESEDESDLEEEEMVISEDDKAQVADETSALLHEPIIVSVEENRQKVESFRLSDVEDTPRSKYGLSGMKIDAKSLLKGADGPVRPPTALNKQSPRRIITILPGTDKKQDAVETTSSTRKMSVPKKKIEKKKQKGDRQRVGGRWSGKLVEPEKEEEEVKMVPSKSSLQGKSSVHQAVKSKASLKPESIAETSVVNIQSDEAKLSRPSVKNLSMDDDMRAAYKPGITSVSNLKSEENSKKKKKKKSSIFSNYKKPGRKSSLGHPSSENQDDDEGINQDDVENEDGDKDSDGAAMYRAASRVTIVQMYSPMERISSAGSRQGVSAPAPTPVEMDGSASPAPPRTNPSSKGRSHSAVQTRGYPSIQGARSKSAGTKGDFPEDYPLELLPLDTRQMSEMSLDKIGTTITEPSERGSLILSESEADGLGDDILEESYRQSNRALSTGMESLMFGTVSRPSTAGTVEDTVRSLLSNMENFPLSRPMSMMSGMDPSSMSPEMQEMQEIANLKGALPMMTNLEGYHARPNTAEGERTVMRYPPNRRPHTAGSEMHVTFLDEIKFSHQFMEGAQIHGFVPDAEQIRPYTSPPPEVFKYHKNDGLTLDVNWQDKMIQRHQLMKIQKELRARSAADKRSLLDLRRRQKRKGLLGHGGCTDQDQGIRRGSYNNGSPGHSLSHSGHMERRKSAPAAGHQNEYRGSSVHARRDQLATPSSSRREMMTPTPKKVSSTDRSKDQQNYASEKAYRFKLSNDVLQSPQDEVNESSHLVVTAQSDRSNPTNRIFPRPHTSKSIPSKPRRYILIPPNRSEPQVARLTPLEAQLLSERFPKSKERLIRKSSITSTGSAFSVLKVIPNLPDQEVIFN
ncbi:uncharacterized protein [Apostichopus japonicus]|uniref:uncharacterized protein isoform X2 n=1 Tax=Stichopus japonicus TaxID=307972 RepID=UPI003AB1CE74